MNQTFLLDVAVGAIAILGGLALALGSLGLALKAHRRRAGILLLVLVPAGLLGILGLFAIASLTGTTPPNRVGGIAFLCGAGVAAIAVGTLRSITRNEAPPASDTE